MSATASDPKTSAGFFVTLSVDFMRKGLAVHKHADFLFGRAEVCAFLAGLPEETALRARLNPDLFKAVA